MPSDALLMPFFRLHDWASLLLARHLFTVKRIILLVAHLALFGFLFPELRRWYGELASDLLVLILFLSPLSRIFRARLLLQLMGIRRELGITMAYLATVHGLGYLLDPLWFQAFIGPYWKADILAVDPRLLFGIAAYLLTLPLLFTSNNLMNRLLGGKRWKALHRLVYLVFVLMLFHRFFLDVNGGFSLVLAWGKTALVLGTYLALKLLAWKNFLPPLRSANRAIAERYAVFEAREKDASGSRSS